MRIYVPSMGRSREIGGTYSVLRFSSPGMRARLVYVVPENEVDSYRAALADQGERGRGVEVLGCPERGIARTRRWIGEHAAYCSEDKFLMCDDDVLFYVRKSPDIFNLRYAEPEDVDVMLALVEKKLETHAHVGISAREGNNRFGPCEPEAVHKNTRTLRCLAYQTAEFLACEHGRVQVMEDFDVNLQLLERGLPNCNIMYHAQGQMQTNMHGGCSTYRSHEVHEASARHLAELHPGVVTLRDKVNKSGGEFGTRKEVTIQWQKAYKQGLAKKERAS